MTDYRKIELGESISMIHVDQREVFVGCNNTKKTCSPAKYIHNLIEEQVESSPDAIAIKIGGQQLSYGELNSRANQLAHRLNALGVGPKSLVALCAERSLEMVIGILGILKGGAAYLPLDPAYPKGRLAFMLEDAKPSVLLMQERLANFLQTHGAPIVSFKADRDSLSQWSEKNLEVRTISDHLAYVIYTSGSTGTPKGVMITHGNLCHYVKAVREPIKITANDHYLHTASISFSSSVRQLMVPLSYGATVVIATGDQIKDPVALFELLKRSGVTILDIVPSYWQSCITALSSLPRKTRESLLDNQIRLILSASEPLLSKIPNDWSHKFRHGASLINMFGQTETTGIVTTYEMPTEHPDENTIVPIGNPIANTQLHILDSEYCPVRNGAPGEICIGGAGVGLGYLNRHELTKEKFIADPFSTGGGARLYRTGDLGRRNANGVIEYLGRLDNQIKIRGHRVELAEIEKVLSIHNAVQTAVVVAYNDRLSNKDLVAYVVLNQQRAANHTDLKQFLKQRLPDYMIPSHFVFMEALPLTPNGKVDRKALPARDENRPDLGLSYRAPRTPTEEILAEIWGHVLKVEKIGIHDNFFNLGGHSLLATQAMSRVRGSLLVELPLRAIFEAPTVAGLAERLEIARRKEQGLSSPALLASPRDKDIPLSFAQQRLWFLDQLEPGSSVYNILRAIRLTGVLNVNALEKSLQEIINRHEALRTTFSIKDGNPVQVITPWLRLSLPIVEITETAEIDREHEAQRRIKEIGHMPFDLTVGPLFRGCLFRLGDEDFILLLALHHIVSDGYSMAVLYHDLSVLYEAFCNGNASPLSDLPIQYADFALWQRQWLEGEVSKQQRLYWREKLANLELLQLPTDRSRPAAQSYRGARRSVELSSELSRGIKALCRKLDATLFMTLLAAFKILLHRYTGQPDIVVGSPIAGRTRQETAELIGFFVNTLVLRSNVAGNSTFRELLGRVRAVALDAYVHQDFPFEKLVEELHPERDLSRTPLFSIFFNMLEEEFANIHLRGLNAELLSIGDAGSKFDLTLYVKERDGEIRLTAAYNADLFEPDTISSMLGHYCNLLERIVENPDRQISNYSLLTGDERPRSFNQNGRFVPTEPFAEFKKQDIEQSIGARFEQQVKLHPANLALTTQEHQWNYNELNRQANRIAHTLLKYSINGGERIALLLDHGAQMVAAILGALKSNNAYVPLDGSHPHERLAEISRDCQAAIILTDKNNLAQACALADKKVQVVDVDQIDAAASTDNPAVAVAPDALAYILYTSGSTGRPKGVMQNHRNVLHHIRCYTNNLRISFEDRLALLATYGTDASVQDIFGTVLNGATLCPLNVKTRASSEIVKLLIAQAVTIYHSTPTVFRYLFANLNCQDAFSAIKLIVLGGEEVQKADVDLFKRIFPEDCMLVNGLGFTESTLALQYFISHKTQLSGYRVPVGYPVEDTEVVLLDETGMNTEVYGEIAIRSEHVALGYWQRPRLSEVAFRAEPQSGTGRLYRTGDMGRLLPDGSIVFCGRKDFQVKIRGYCVEPVEIETVLVQHPAIQESIVLARENRRGERQLVAYTVMVPGCTPTTDELRSFLQKTLPGYMVPSAFVFMKSFPLNANGKLDRKALPDSDHSRAGNDKPYVAPRDSLEIALTQIWEKLLSTKAFSITSNFFDLGGHSLLSVRLFAEIEKTTGRQLPVSTIFQAPTIEQLAKMLRREDALESQFGPWSSYRACVVPFQPYGSKPPLFWFNWGPGDFRLPRYLDHDQPVYGLQHQSQDGLRARYTSIESMASHYVDEIRTVQAKGPYFIGGICIGGLVIFETARQLQKQGEEVALLALLDPSSNPWYRESSITRPAMPSLSSGVAWFRDKVHRIFRDLAVLGPQERLGYAQARAKVRIAELQDRIGWMWRCVLCEALGRPLPPSLRTRYIMSIYGKARRAYIPQPYRGRVILFKTQQRYLNDQWPWEHLILDGLEIQKLGVDHDNVFKEPYVQTLAKILSEYLSEAQKNI